ncbi:MAG: hypothetical protein ACK502_10045 [Alphaproteobacteria bacterium]
MATEQEIIEFLSSEMWVRKSRIKPDTDIRQILGKDIQRNMMFLDAFQKKYNVNMAYFDAIRHFKVPSDIPQGGLVGFLLIVLGLAGILAIKMGYPVVGGLFFLWAVCILFSYKKTSKEMLSSSNSFSKVLVIAMVVVLLSIGVYQYFILAATSSAITCFFAAFVGFNSWKYSLKHTTKYSTNNKPKIMPDIIITPRLLAQVANQKQWPKEIYGR